MTSTAADYFGNGLSLDFFLHFTGRKLGGGCARETFLAKLDSSIVIKIETGTNDFQNVAEFHLWDAAPDWARKWLAPVRSISNYGHVLVQDYCEPLTGKLPKRVPAFLADFKRENWGVLDGHPVCFDYGRNRAFEIGLKTRQMVEPEWHS